MRFASTAVVTLLGLWAGIAPAQCGSSWSEDFDAAGLAGLPANFVGTTTAAPFLWTLNSGPTPSQATGPEGDHGSGSGSYLYTEASGSFPGTQATLLLPCADLTGLFNPHLQFALHMSGVGMGILRVEARDAGGQWNLVTSFSGDRGIDWTEVSIPVQPLGDGTVHLRLVAVRGAGPTSDIAIDSLRLGTPVAPLWQMNQPAATFAFEGTSVPTPRGPRANVTRYLGTTVTMELRSFTVGQQYDLLYLPQPAISSASGGLVTLGLQVLNLDLFSPTLQTLSAGRGGINFLPWPGDASYPVSLSTANTIAAQMVVTEGSLPDGYALSQASEVTWTDDPCLAATPVTLGDDSFVSLPLNFSMLFYGISRDTIFVGSNGIVTMGAASTSFPVDAFSFNNGLPTIAGLALDLDPSAGGTVSAFSDGIDTWCVVFDEVPEFGRGGANSFTIRFENLNSIVLDYTAGFTAVDGIVGISPGGGWSSYRLLDLDRPPYPLNQSDMPYESFASTNDLSGKIVTIQMNGFGFPTFVL